MTLSHSVAAFGTLGYKYRYKMHFGISSYSFSAELYKDGALICESTVCDVTSDRSFALSILVILSDKLVSPKHLHDVLLEIIP